MNPDTQPQTDQAEQSAELGDLTSDSLIEEVSIDGMCGVY